MKFEVFEKKNEKIVAESEEIDILQYLMKPNYEFTLQTQVKSLDETEGFVNYKLIFAKK